MFVILLSAALVFCITILVMLACVGRLPFSKKTEDFVSAAQSDKNIFRQQMAEIDALNKQGLLDEQSADQARTELGRQILAAEKKLKESSADKIEKTDQTKISYKDATDINNKKLGLRIILSLAVFFIPLFCFIIYHYQGQPFEPDKPFSAFMQRHPASFNPQEKIVYTEALAARNPENVVYIDKLADAYLEAQRFQDAANAYTHAMRLKGKNVHRQLGYALALTGFEEGVVNQDAAKAFQEVLKRDPNNPQAQLFLARGLVQDGKKEEAIALLQGFLQKTPSDSPWRKNLKTAISALQNPEKLHDKQSIDSPSLSPKERDFIAANLNKLETKLANKPDDLKAWKMLINAYILLNDKDKAQSAFQKGKLALSDKEKQDLLAFAKGKGLNLTKSN